MVTSCKLYCEKRNIRRKRKKRQKAVAAAAAKTSVVMNEEHSRLLNTSGHTPSLRSTPSSLLGERDVNANHLLTPKIRNETDEESCETNSSTSINTRRAVEIARTCQPSSSQQSGQMTFHHYRNSPQPPPSRLHSQLHAISMFATLPLKAPPDPPVRSFASSMAFTQSGPSSALGQLEMIDASPMSGTEYLSPVRTTACTPKHLNSNPHNGFNMLPHVKGSNVPSSCQLWPPTLLVQQDGSHTITTIAHTQGDIV